MEKTLSIIVPTYNMEKYLRKCLDSLIVSDENMQRLEVLVINDGSKDSSSQIAHEYEAKYPQTFRVIDKENGNYGSCINRGLKEATGKYVKVLDADDYFDRAVFDDFLNHLKRTEADLILNAGYRVDENGKELSMWSYSFPHDEIIQYRFVRNCKMHSVTYKTDNLREINYYQTEGVSYTDQEWVYWPMTTVKTICYFNLFLYNYLIGRPGQTMDKDIYLKSLKHELVVQKRMIELWETGHKALKEHRSYIEFRLNNRMSILFSIYMTKRGRVCLQDLYDFDVAVRKEFPIYYQYSSNTFLLGDKIRFHYLRYWRKNHTIFPYNILCFIKLWYTNHIANKQ